MRELILGSTSPIDFVLLVHGVLRPLKDSMQVKKVKKIFASYRVKLPQFRGGYFNPTVQYTTKETLHQ